MSSLILNPKNVQIFNEINFLPLGMLPHKLNRGKEAMDRLKCFEGIPAPYDKKKRVVVPSALKVLRLKTRRRVSIFLLLMHMSTHVYTVNVLGCGMYYFSYPSPSVCLWQKLLDKNDWPKIHITGVVCGSDFMVLLEDEPCISQDLKTGGLFLPFGKTRAPLLLG